MKIIKQGKDSITVELSPNQLVLLREGLSKEVSSRRKVWSKLESRFPEELLYHAASLDDSTRMLKSVNDGISKYKLKGIL